MRPATTVFLSATLLAASASAQTRESPNMLPPSPFDPQAAPQRLTPPTPPPWDQPLSVSGVDVLSPEHTQTTAAPEGPRMRELEHRIAQLEREMRNREPTPWVEWLVPSLLLQPQLIWNFYNAAASPNASSGALPPGIGSNDVTATPAGTTNPDFFRLRRARLKLDFLPSEYARFVFEIEPVPRDPSVPGSATIARQIEAIARLPLSRRMIVEIGAGSFEVPFGNEWREHHGDRSFIERSYFQRNMLPGDFDLGLRAAMLMTKKVDLQLALINGRTFGELDHGANLDLNRPKDGTLSLDVTLGDFEFGTSGYVGEGALVDAVNLRFKQYTRYAWDANLGAHIRTRLGETRAFGEFVVGNNMDRGIIDPGNLPAIPLDLTQSVVDRTEVGALVRLDQDLGRFFTLGARWDYYSPDVNLANDARHTLGAVLAVHIVPEMQKILEPIGPRIQAMLEYAHAIDTIRPSGPAGDTKQIDTLSFVLQGRL